MLSFFRKKISAKQNKPKYKWPECEPPHEIVGFSAFNINGTQYKKKEVSPGIWNWVIDEEMMALSCNREFKRRALYWALQTRVLTDDELQEAEQYGYSLNIDMGVPFREADKRRDLQDAWFQQRRLQALERGKDGSKPE